MEYLYSRPTADEWDVAAVEAGFITEEERIRRAYRRILENQGRSRPFISRSKPHDHE